VHTAIYMAGAAMAGLGTLRGVINILIGQDALPGRP
jgi:hypothetical protein